MTCSSRLTGFHRRTRRLSRRPRARGARLPGRGRGCARRGRSLRQPFDGRDPRAAQRGGRRPPRPAQDPLRRRLSGEHLASVRRGRRPAHRRGRQGIGIMQVTTIPPGWTSSASRPTSSTTSRSASDILVDKWGYAPTVFPVIGAGDPRCYESWFFAVWAYNGLDARQLVSLHGLGPHRRRPRALDRSRRHAGAQGLAGRRLPGAAGRDAAAGALVERDAAAEARS